MNPDYSRMNPDYIRCCALTGCRACVGNYTEEVSDSMAFELQNEKYILYRNSHEQVQCCSSRHVHCNDASVMLPSRLLRLTGHNVQPVVHHAGAVHVVSLTRRLRQGCKPTPAHDQWRSGEPDVFS
jgi:hypothetical protein